MATSTEVVSDGNRKEKQPRYAVMSSSDNMATLPHPMAPGLRGRSRPSTDRRDDVCHALPHSVEAEMGVLGSMVLDAQNAIPTAQRSLTVDHFYVSNHRTIFEALCDMHRCNSAVDLLTFTQYLRDMGQLDKVGGPPFVTHLFTFVPVAANIPHYIDIVRDKFLRRRLIEVVFEIVRKTYHEEDDFGEALQTAQRELALVRLLGHGELDNVENLCLSDLLSFKAGDDPNTLIGKRWLCRGSTCLWAGGAGYGKSSLQMQSAVSWAHGDSVFGIQPVQPLKSLIIQAENDLGDMAEQLQGVIKGTAKAGDTGEVSQQRRSLIEKNIVITRVVGVSGAKFLSLLDSLIDRHKPDLIWIDPLFAFAGCDLMNAKDVGLFLREGVIAAAVRHGVCIHIVHHVGKPDRDNDAKKNWSELDFLYLGFGTCEIQNSFRAVNVLLPVSGHEGVFRLILSKRGTRAGAKSPDGEYVTSVYLTHSTTGISWVQTDKPDIVARVRRQGKDTQFQSRFSADDVLSEMSYTNGWKASALQKHMRSEVGMSEKTFYRIWADLKSKQRIYVNSDYEWFRKSSGSAGDAPSK